MSAVIADIDRLLSARITLAADERRVLLAARAEIVQLSFAARCAIEAAPPEPLCICGMGIAPCRLHNRQRG